MADIYGQRIQTTVNTKYLPFVTDSVLNSNVVFQRIVRAAKKWSGRTLRVPVKVSKNTTGTSFRGLSTFSVAVTDNRQYMEYTPSFYQITVALPGDELSVADTEEKVLDLMKLTIQSDTEDMADNLGDIIYADGTGNGSLDPLGLAALVDDGTSVASIGGLARATYTTLKSTVTTAATLTFAVMDTMWSNCTSGAQQPTLIAVTKAIGMFYAQLLRPQERIMKDVGTMKGMKMGTGIGLKGYEYNGCPVVVDEKDPTGIMYFINEEQIDFYALPAANTKPVAYKSQIKGNDYDAPVGLGFSWSDWIVPDNAFGVVGHIYFGGQFIAKNPKRCGKLTGITGI